MFLPDADDRFDFRLIQFSEREIMLRAVADDAGDAVCGTIFINPRRLFEFYWRAFGHTKTKSDNPVQTLAHRAVHSARWFNQVGVGVEIRFLRKPVEAPSGVRDRCHGEFTARSHLDQHMHAGMRRDSTSGEFGRDLTGFGVKDDL